jgi:zinc/manganese transport system substrate-binding protein
MEKDLTKPAEETFLPGRRALLALLPILLAPGARAAAPLPVVASFSILGDMVREVAGPLASVHALVGPDADVHVYQPRPADLLALRRAGLVVMNGLDLEGWLTRLLPASGTKAPVVVAASAVTPRHLGQGIDPHAWQNPLNGVLYARAIAAGLARVLPAQAAEVAARAAAYEKQLTALDAEIAALVATVPPERRRILTSHDAFFYYGARYGIEFIGVQGLDTEFEPSAAAIAALIRQIKAEHIRAVFVENMTNPALIRMVARESGVRVGEEVYSDALSRPTGPAATYVQLLRTNTHRFVAAMLS